MREQKDQKDFQKQQGVELRLKFEQDYQNHKQQELQNRIYARQAQSNIAQDGYRNYQNKRDYEVKKPARTISEHEFRDSLRSKTYWANKKGSEGSQNRTELKNCRQRNKKVYSSRRYRTSTKLTAR